MSTEMLGGLDKSYRSILENKPRIESRPDGSTSKLIAMMQGGIFAPRILNDLKAFKSNAHVELSYTNHLSMVGMKYRAGYSDFKAKRKGTLVLMVPEPRNPYDPNAVACYITWPDGNDGYDWIHAGYIAKNNTHLLRKDVVHLGTLYAKTEEYWTIEVEGIRNY